MLRPVLRTTVVVLSAIFMAGTAQAVPFASDISIVGTSFYDTNVAEEIGIANVEGSIFDTIVGLNGSSQFDGNTIIGANPRAGALTDLGDEIGLGAVGLAARVGSFQASASLVLEITNTSATDAYEVGVEVALANSVFSQGEMAWVQSTLAVADTRGGSQVSSLVSSTIVGNFQNGQMVAGLGGSLADGGVSPLTYVLNPGETVTLAGNWTVGGAVLGEGSLAALQAAGASFKVASVTSLGGPGQPIPEPAAALLFGLGLVVVRGARSR